MNIVNFIRFFPYADQAGDASACAADTYFSAIRPILNGLYPILALSQKRTAAAVAERLRITAAVFVHTWPETERPEIL